MSKGKYSPCVKSGENTLEDFRFNAKGEVPVEYVPGTMDWNHEIMSDGYDKDGFDSYGYSAYNKDGCCSGMMSGIDKAGYTEEDYQSMTDDEFNDLAGFV